MTESLHGFSAFLSGSAHPTAGGWYALFGLESGFPVFATMAIAFVAFLFAILMPLSFALGFVERKLTADLQARVGPNRTAGRGALQVLADFVKLGSKTGVSDPRARFWETARTASLYSTFAFLPLGTTLIFFDAELGTFLPFLSFAVASLCALLAGEAANDVDEEFSAHRSAFYWISAWLPAFLAATLPAVAAGSAQWSVVIRSQDGGPFRWLALSSPFGFVGFIAFLLSGLVAFQLPPFHALDEGLRRRSGESLALRRLNEFYALFAWCVFATVLFLGGADRPGGLEPSALLSLIEIGTVLLKASGVLVLLGVVAKAIPQLRQDQVTDFCWRALIPVTAICLLGQVAWTLIFAAPIGGQS